MCNGTMDLESQWKRICLELKVSHADRAVRSKLALGEEKVVYAFCSRLAIFAP